LGVLLGYGLLLLSLSCFALFAVNAVVPLVPLEWWFLFLCTGLFWLAGAPALLFAVSPRFVGGPLGALLRLYTRMLAMRAPTAPVPWSRFAGLFIILSAVSTTMLFAGLFTLTLQAGHALSLGLVLADLAWAAGMFLFLFVGSRLLGTALRRRIRSWQTQQ
jgi:hypothetical protein